MAAPEALTYVSPNGVEYEIEQRCTVFVEYIASGEPIDGEELGDYYDTETAP